MRSLLLSAPVILAACAPSAPIDAPSLLPRPIESRSDAEPVGAVQVAVADPALDSRITGQVRIIDTAVKAFDAASPMIATRVERSKGAAEGSDRWIDGQSAIGELQQARTAVDAAMADLEEIAIDRATTGAPPYPALEAAIAKAQADLDRQAAVELRIRALIGA